jgi:hypothetical protein
MILREESSRLRVVLTLDAGESDRSTLDLAANLAARLDAELTGIFLEDARILEALALPQTRVQSLHGASGAWAPAEMLRALRIHGERLRADLAAAAARAQAEHTFAILRGEPAQVLPELWQARDLIALASRTLVRELSTPLSVRTTYAIQSDRQPGARPMFVFCEADPVLRETLARLGFLHKEMERP